MNLGSQSGPLECQNRSNQVNTGQQSTADGMPALQDFYLILV